MRKKVLITGISGQDGFYLSKCLIDAGYDVVGTSHSAGTKVIIDGINLPIYYLTLLDYDDIKKLLAVVCPQIVFNLAARASSSQLFDDPIATSEINGVAVVRILEAIRQLNSGIKFCQASSCEIFSGTKVSPQYESTAKCPVNAYGAAKAFGDHVVSAYRSVHNIFASSAILYPHESPRRSNHFLVRKVTSAAAAIAKGKENRVVLGDLSTIRDWGFAPDYMKAMLKIVECDCPNDFIIATGIGHSVSDVCEIAFKFVGLDWNDYVYVDKSFQRGPDLVPKIGSPDRACGVLNWKPTLNFEDMIGYLVNFELEGKNAV
jgi:GDPmannose 4,6-dehydratase